MKRTSPNPILKWLGNAAILAGSLLTLATLAGLLGRVSWILDLFSHFPLQYAIATLPVIVTLLICRRFRIAGIFVLCLAYNLTVTIPYYFGSNQQKREGEPIRIASINVNRMNEEYDLLRSFIDQANPDIVLLTETPQNWVDAMNYLQATHPFYRVSPRPDNFGIALYSRVPLGKIETLTFGAGVPSILAEIQRSNSRVSLLCTHPPPPINRELSLLRNQQLEAISNLLMSVEGPKILVGDLNVSPWSAHFSRLTSAARLRDASLGHGIKPTWPTDKMLVRIPIDLCLISDEIGVNGILVGPHFGSDHFPLVVDVVLPE